MTRYCIQEVPFSVPSNAPDQPIKIKVPCDCKILSGKLMEGQYSQDTEEGRANLFVGRLKVFGPDAVAGYSQERVFTVLLESDNVCPVSSDPLYEVHVQHVCSFPKVGTSSDQYHLLEHKQFSLRAEYAEY